MTTTTKAERNEALERLQDLLNPGTVVYTVLRHVVPSGMSRSIDMYFIRDNEPFYLSWYAATVMDMNIDQKHRGIKISGAGMDMGFSLVYELGSMLYPDGFDLPEGMRGRNGDTSGFDIDGGYALVQRWL